MAQKRRGVIAAGNQHTAEAGLEILRLGGNAFDAAIAATLTSFVTESVLTSPAGGGFLLAHTSHSENILFDFFTQTPTQKKPSSEIQFYPITVNFGGAVQEFHIGIGSAAVPGNIAGVFHVHQRLGQLPFHVIAEPAIYYARTGIQLNQFQAYCLQLLEPILTASAPAKQIYAPCGKLLQAGDTLQMSELADTLSLLAEKGSSEFYEGEIAHQLIQDCQQQGGHLTLTDLKRYQVLERQPLTLSYRGHTLLTNPPPSAGGKLISFSLALLSAVNLANLEFGSSRHLQVLAQTMRLTNAARKDRLEIDRSIPETVILYRNQLMQSINKWGSTTHISVLDQEGNAASITTSSGEGSSYIIPGTGIMMNNMLGEEDLNPNGFHQWSENVRIASMMSPTMLLTHEGSEIVLGSGGSNRIRTAILQVISNILDFKMDVRTAVDSPRIHWENQALNAEPGFDEIALQSAALPTDHLQTWQQQNMFFGGVHTVAKTADGRLEGAGDLRRNGERFISV
jgi:gamma-glutamyltranspeptidase/glutathione hydrolase